MNESNTNMEGEPPPPKTLVAAYLEMFWDTRWRVPIMLTVLAITSMFLVWVSLDENKLGWLKSFGSDASTDVDLGDDQILDQDTSSLPSRSGLEKGKHFCFSSTVKRGDKMYLRPSFEYQSIDDFTVEIGGFLIRKLEFVKMPEEESVLAFTIPSALEPGPTKLVLQHLGNSYTMEQTFKVE